MRHRVRPVNNRAYAVGVLRAEGVEGRHASRHVVCVNLYNVVQSELPIRRVADHRFVNRPSAAGMFKYQREIIRSDGTENAIWGKSLWLSALSNPTLCKASRSR